MALARVGRCEMQEMMLGGKTLFEHLHKLVRFSSEQELENLLLLLWETRKSGLSSPQKSSIQSLLKLTSPGDLDLVLPALRSLIRNCVHKNLEGDDMLKLLPPDLPLELQSMLLILLQRHQNQWKGELSQEQTSSSHQLNSGLSLPSLSSSSSEVSGLLLPAQVGPSSQINVNNLGAPTPIISERNVLCFPQPTLPTNAISPEILGVLPQLKSISWTVENKNLMPANRVAIVSLKLEDYSKRPSHEMEVKFQLTRDTLEAVLRSMTYINEQLSHYVGSSSAPMQKKQRR